MVNLTTTTSQTNHKSQTNCTKYDPHSYLMVDKKKILSLGHTRDSYYKQWINLKGAETE